MPAAKLSIVDVVDLVIPLASTLVGAVITYVVNVRVRRRTYVEDLFNRAIAAVAAADASVDFMAGVGRPKHLSDDEYDALQKWMVTEGLKNWTTKVAVANEALAQVLPYQPDIARWLPFHTDSGVRPAQDVIAALKLRRQQLTSA